MAEKVTIMKLKVDLQCDKCYKKVKKLLCKFPQIRDQVYDEKHNVVTITVVCCNPEKIRDKLCCEGCGSIKSIEIVEPPKPKPPPPAPKPVEPPAPKPSPPPPEPKPKPPPPAPKPVEPPTPKPSPPSAPVCTCPSAARPPVVVPIGVCCGPCYEGVPGGPCYDRPPPPPVVVPIGVCCGPCYEGVPGGPCYDRPPPCYGGYYGRPVCDSYGGGRPCYVSRCCDEYLSEENTSGCTIM